MKSRSLYSHSVFLRKKISPWLKWRTPWREWRNACFTHYSKPEEQLDAGHSGRSYCHNQQIDDVPQGDPHITYSNKMQVTIRKCEMEMNVLHGQILVQDARVYCHWRAHKSRKRSKRDGCLPCVAVPSHISQDTDLLWFAPVNPVESIVCTRMLRKYHRNASLKQWYFKSAFFLEKRFSTHDSCNCMRRNQTVTYQFVPISYTHLFTESIHSPQQSDWSAK